MHKTREVVGAERGQRQEGLLNELTISRTAAILGMQIS